MNATLDASIEKLVNCETLATVLESLSRVCAEKSEYLQSNWQDSATAKLWDEMSNRLATQSVAAERKGL